MLTWVGQLQANAEQPDASTSNTVLQNHVVIHKFFFTKKHSMENKDQMKAISRWMRKRKEKENLNHEMQFENGWRNKLPR